MTELEKLIELIADVLDVEPEELTADMQWEEMEGWDSVNALRILTNLEAEWEVRLTLEQFLKAKTIRDLSYITGSVYGTNA